MSACPSESVALTQSLWGDEELSKLEFPFAGQPIDTINSIGSIDTVAPFYGNVSQIEILNVLRRHQAARPSALNNISKSSQNFLT